MITKKRQCKNRLQPIGPKNRCPSIFTNMTNTPRITYCNPRTMLHMSKNRLFDKKSHVWSPPSLGDHFPTRIRKDVSGGLLHCFLFPFSTLPLNKKGLSLHATCNSMHSPCNLHKRHATPCNSMHLLCNSSETE